MTQLIINSSKAIRKLVVVGQSKSKPAGNFFEFVASSNEAGLKWIKDHFKTKFVNHSKAINEFLGLLNWPSIGASAENYVLEMTGSVQCYTNKIIMEFRNKDESQTNWAKALVAAMKGLPEYINDHQKGGIKWNSRSAAASIESLNPNAGPSANKSSAPAPVAAAPKPVAKPALNIKPPVAQAKTPSAQRISDKGVEIKYFDGAVPEIPQLKQDDMVTFFGCKNTTLEVKAKVKAISVLNCEKCDVVPNDVIGMLELTNSKRLKIWLEGTVKSISTDKCDGIEIYLNQASKEVSVLSSFSSAVNLEYPDPKEEGNYIESAIPEQITAHFNKDGKLVSQVYEHE